MTRPLSRADQRTPREHLAADGARPRRGARAAGLAVAAALLVPALTACGAGFDAQTNQVRLPADGLRADVGDIRVLNAVLIQEGDAANVSLTIANRGEEPLTLIGLASGSTVAELSTQPEIAAGGTVQIGTSEVSAVLRGLDPSVQPGTYAPLTLAFDPQREVQMNAAVFSANRYYATLAPAEPESPEPELPEPAPSSPVPTQPPSTPATGVAEGGPTPDEG
ncbi:copper chaperone PCu(A)C [Motilibacter aurantiacus]|uniref:copper chaperone PCu(A)C n=1 Tax=Motilibacter aurantiacus TaxID=2714955 RepID=UPI00140E8BA5|nr:copper chaperone PCu(A)C [Motilibacter aurantiacus]NHC46830.1 copper chaperone PCu(A)C [Motilibacter aurantiacus]